MKEIIQDNTNMIHTKEAREKLKEDLLGVLSDVEFNLHEIDEIGSGIKKHTVITKLITIVHNILKGVYD